MDYYDQVKKDRVSMMETTGPNAIMRYGGFCPKKMPLESNNPRSIQGQKLRRGGCVKLMKGSAVK